MKKENWSDIEINKVFNFWKLEEYFTPFDYPELYLTVKENGKSIPFDAYHNAYSFREFPLNNYKRHNVYLAENIKAEVPLHMAHPNGRVCGAKRPKCEAERSHHL